MILLDSDVLIDLLRKYPPAVGWFDALHEDEELVVSGYVVMEVIQGERER
jgi:predicted nucleic acid-binding protein